MLGKRVFLLIAAFVLAAVPFFSHAQPAQAQIDVFEGLRTVYNRVSGFVDSVWDAAACITDIDCLIKNAVVSLLNNSLVFFWGISYTDMSGQTLQAMMNGDWGYGLTFAAASAIDAAYQDPPGLREMHFAEHLKWQLSRNIFNKSASATAGENLLNLGGEVVQTMWEATRNLAYGLFLLVMIAIGFMIMFQKQIAPRVVLSFTSALPRLLIGLVLITFSFSLVALTFDVIGVFGSTLISEVISSGVEDVEDLEYTTTGGVMRLVLGDTTARIAGSTLFLVVQPFLTAPESEQTGAQALQALILLNTMSVVMAIGLIGAAIQIILKIVKLLYKAVFSPIIFLIGSLPGQEEQISGFFRGIVADCAAFPAIAFVLTFTALFLRDIMESIVDPNEISEALSHALGGIPAIYSTSILASFIVVISLVFVFKAPSIVSNAINPPVRRK